MKISDYKNEDALDLIADILEPVAKVFADEEIGDALKSGRNLIAVRLGLKNHKSEIIEILARLDGVDKKDYKGNAITMTAQLLTLLNDEELTDFFSSQGQKSSETSFGSVMGNTEEEKK